jgi:ATP-dependent Clp protease ATP-binding subunit ClpA
VIKADHKMTKDLTDADFDYIITMTNRYGANQAQPSKSEKVIDMACSSAACARRNYVSKDDILSAVAQMGGVSVSYLNQSKHDLILKMREELPKKILGQPTLEKIIDGIEGAYAGLNPPNKPMGCYLIQGPAGTGKTETAKALARYLFDDENALVQLNMAEYMEKHTVSRLIGAPAGYVGHDSTESTLLDPVAKKRRCVVLLDEVEKAHPEVFGVLLGILNDGSTKDQQGKNVSFTDVIFIMTTNKGAMEAAKVLENTADMGKWSTAERSPAEIAKALDESYAAAAKSIFPGRPEMLDRIKELGALVTYVPLTKPVIEQMVDMEIQSMNKLFSTTATVGMKNVTIELSQEAKQQLADAGYDSTVGARPLKGEVRRQVGNPLGAWLMNPANEQAIAAVVAEHGSAKIVLTTIGKNLAPQIVKGDAPKAAVVNEVVNDNVAETAPVAVNKQIATVRKPKI